MPRCTAGLAIPSAAMRPRSAHAVCEAVLSPFPASDSSSYEATVSPQPPSAFWRALSHSTARRTHGARRSSPIAARPSSTDQVP